MKNIRKMLRGLSIKKLFAPFVASVTLFAFGVPAFSGAITVQDLQQQIAALQAQLAQLQGQSVGIPGACVGITFTRNLRAGSSGSDVKCLQALMNTDTATQVATSGFGSPGNETVYFGPLTRGAVIRFQQKYAATILAPWGLTTGTGFVGSTTRAKLNLMLTSPNPSPNPNPNPNPPPPTSAGLTVSLASDNPPSGTIVNGQALAPLARFIFANGDNSSISVTSLKLRRIGISSDATLANVYLFNGAQRVTDSSSVASGIISFNNSNGIFSIPGHTSDEISVYSDISGGTGETVGISINSVSDISATSNPSTTIRGNFPISGNLMTVASVSLAGANFSSTVTPAAASVNPQMNYNAWQATLTINNRAVMLGRISLREIGTVNYSDLQNFKLYIDGARRGSAVQNLDANGYVTFDLGSNPATLQPGSHTVNLWTDIIGGSSRTFTFSLRSPAEITLTDTQFNANILATVNNSSFSPLTSGTQSISSGTVIVTKAADSPAGNIVKGSSGAVLARYTLTAAGEPVKIQTLRAAATSSNACKSLSNGALFANGAQVGSTANLNTTNNSAPYTTFNLGSSLTVNPGTPITLEIRADTLCNDGTNTLAAGDTLQAKLNSMSGTSNAQGNVSMTTLDVPSTDVVANQLTVAAGALTLAQYPAFPGQTFVSPVNNTKLADFTLTADTTENVNLGSFQVTLTNIAAANVHNLYVTYGNQTSNVLATPNTTNTFSINYQLPAGQTVHVMVFGDVISGFTGSNTHFDLVASGTTANSGTSITTNGGTPVAGQSLTFASSGTFSASLDASTPIAQAVAGNKTVNAANYKLTGANDDFTINEVRVTLPTAAASSVIQNAALRDGATTLATVPFNGTNFDFTGLNVSVPRNTNKVLSVDFVLTMPNATNGTDQKNVKPTLDYVKYFNSQGVQATVSPAVAGNDLYVYKSVPTVTAQNLTAGSLINGASTEIGRFTVSADAAGPIAIKQMKFTNIISNPNAGTPTLSQFRLFRGNQDITSLVTIENSAGTDLTGASTIGAGTNTIVVTFTNEEAIGASSTQTYSLRAEPLNFLSTSANGRDSESTSLLSDSSQNGSNMFVVASGTGSIVKLAQDNAGTGATNYNFIWSDYGAVSHASAPGTSSNDWANGYLITNLPLSSQALSAQ